MWLWVSRRRVWLWVSRRRVLATLACVLQAFDGGAVFGERWGGDPDGTPLVVALHGWGRDHADFAGVVGPGAAGGPLPALALDLPGFGASPPPPDPWGSAQYAEAVVRVLTGPDGPPGPVVIVGHSLGGRVGVRVAAARPDLVAGLALCGAPVGPRVRPRARPAAGFRAVRRLHRLGLVGEGAMERARQRYGSSDYRAAAGVMRPVLVRMIAEDYAEPVAALRCPVELVWGDDDDVVPLAMARTLVATIPDARLTVCPGAGHFVPTAAPADLRSAVERLVSERGAQAR